jgi:transcriptional regulator
MYIPYHNSETRIPILRQMMAAHPLAAVVTLGASGLVATHMPLVLEDDGSEFGLLKGHVSRANSQWKDPSPNVEALAIFSGPQHYISPNWYPSKLEDGKEVPTWNYVVVHAYGPLRIVEDAAWILGHLNSLVDTHEAASPIPWKVSDAPADFIASLMKGIVGFELPIRRLEGKWKVSQNRNEEDRVGAMEGLAQLGTPESVAMARLISAGRPQK